MRMTVGSLFAGIGGFDLAFEWAGVEIRWQVEKDEYCQKVLQKHWPNVKRFGDIKEYRGLPPVDVICGGFPCQPFSQAGKRGGEDDDRYLWPEMLRVIRSVRPRYVVGENVSGLVTLDDGLVFERVLSDLEGEGYAVESVVIPACAVDARHRRDRVWIVAHTDGSQWGPLDSSGSGDQRRDDTNRVQERQKVSGGSSRSGTQGIVADAHGERSQGWYSEIVRERAAERTSGESCASVGNANGAPSNTHTETGRPRRAISEPGRWLPEPDVGRVADGIPDRVDRLRALGNAIVPQVAYPIAAAIRRHAELTISQ